MPDLKDAIKKGKSERLPNWKWQIIRERILKRDNYTCVLCPSGGDEVDHIVPKGLGGTDEDKNLRTLCNNCHKKKTKKDIEKMRRRDRFRLFGVKR